MIPARPAVVSCCTSIHVDIYTSPSEAEREEKYKNHFCPVPHLSSFPPAIYVPEIFRVYNFFPSYFIRFFHPACSVCFGWLTRNYDSLLHITHIRARLCILYTVTFLFSVIFSPTRRPCPPILAQLSLVRIRARGVTEKTELVHLCFYFITRWTVNAAPK